ncbi:MAG: methyltransferase [Thermoplasmata archaeon]|nr:methyltransferase [Thermoplasmata archaeon]MCI4344519.1 methyltransferase [Thermoplasmata archaeon]
MRSLPRHSFVETAWRKEAYADRPLPLPGSEATISAPHMVALQLEWSELFAGAKVLEVGAGSGYLACLLARLCSPGGVVEALEVDPQLARFAAENVRANGYAGPVRIRATDGVRGWPGAAPYDRILVSCATPRVQPAWREQLKDGGVLVAPVGDSWEQVLVRWRKEGTSGTTEEGPACRFVPLVEGR